MAMPADAPSNPASQPGALSNLPLSYSSGYSPMCQTFPSLSCAKKASSASTSSPSEQSLSQTTTVFTPFISLVKSVTVVTTRREMRSPLSMADPSNTECAPGSRGNHLLSTVVELSKLVRSKSFALTVLKSSDWIRSEVSCVPDSELATAQAEAENTKSNAAVAKLMRRRFIFSPPFSLLPGRLTFHRSVRSPEAEVQGGQDEQVKQRRGDQPAQNDDRHGVLDLITGDAARNRQGNERQPRSRGGHQDRREPLLRPAQDEPGPELLALFALEVLEVADHQDPVSSRDAEHGQKSDQRAQREYAAAHPYRQHSAHQRHRQREEEQQSQTQTPEGSLQEE